MNKIILFFLFVWTCVFSSSSVLAEELSDLEKTKKRSQTMIDSAYEMMMKGQKPPSEAPLLKPEVLRKNRVDIDEIVKKFETSPKTTSEYQLFVFVSTSMPMQALEMLARDSKLIGATLVFRGLNVPLSKPKAITMMLEFLEPVIKTGAKMQIDPQSFQKYKISKVPTFVIAKAETNCGDKLCPLNYDSMSGDVSIAYALSVWANQSNKYGEIAEKMLSKIPMELRP